MIDNMEFDIRSSDKAKHTLDVLTGVPISIWEQNLNRESDFDCPQDFVEQTINNYGHLPINLGSFEFVFSHITTSSNKCHSIEKNGLLDLKQAYLCADSELRIFLNDNGIFIDLKKSKLKYRTEIYDIKYAPNNKHIIKAPYEEQCQKIGRKFYYDYTICGFLSIDSQDTYLGDVHHRPEILDDIDNLLHLNLSQKWEKDHKPYNVVAKINGDEIECEGMENKSEKEKVMHYLTLAYNNAFHELDENIILLQNNKKILPSNIIGIEPFNIWKF